MMEPSPSPMGGMAVVKPSADTGWKASVRPMALPSSALTLRLRLLLLTMCSLFLSLLEGPRG